MKLSFLESRNPWLDREVLEFFCRLPEHYRYDKALYRATLLRMFPGLMQALPMAAQHSLENRRQIIRSGDHRRFFRAHLVEKESALHEIWDPVRIGTFIDRFYSGRRTASVRTSAAESIKTLLRERAGPVYRLLKTNLPSGTVMRELAPEQVLARLVTLKLWCDQWG